MSLRRPRFLIKEKPDDVEAVRSTWDHIVDSKNAAKILMDDILGSINERIISVDADEESIAPALSVSGHPASNKLIYKIDRLSLTRMRRWPTRGDATHENSHFNGIKLRRYSQQKNVLTLASWHQIDIRESGVVCISAHRDEEADTTIKSLCDNLSEKLISKPNASEFGVRFMALNPHERGREFGLYSDDRQTDLYIPASLIVEDQMLRDYVAEQVRLAVEET